MATAAPFTVVSR